MQTCPCKPKNHTVMPTLMEMQVAKMEVECDLVEGETLLNTAIC